MSASMPSLVSKAMASKLFKQSVMDSHPTYSSNKNLPPHLCQLRLNTRGLNCFTDQNQETYSNAEVTQITACSVTKVCLRMLIR